MSSFTDRANREWQLRINVATMRRGQSAGVDLSMPIRKLQDYFFEDVYLCDALWCVIAPDAEKLGVSKSQFEEAVDGKVLAEGRDALFDALCEYFDAGKAQMLRDAIAATQAEMAQALTTLNGSTAAKVNLDTTSEPAE